MDIIINMCIRKVLLDIGFGVVEQIQTAMHVGKVANAEAIGGIQLRLQIIAARIAHIG